MQKSGMVISRRRVVTAALLAVPLAGLSRFALDQDVQAADVSVNIMNFKFMPTPLTIPVGTTVVWTNQDTAPHTATSDPGSAFTFDTGMLQKGQSGKVTFNQAGTFTYFCTVHPNMHGTVTVTSCGGQPPQRRPRRRRSASAVPRDRRANRSTGDRCADCRPVCGRARRTDIAGRATGELHSPVGRRITSVGDR